MKYVKMLCLIVMGLAFHFTVSAQKFGHINSAQLVETHPKLATANTALEAFRVSVTTPFEEKARTFQAKYQFFAQEMQAGTLSKVTAQTRQEDLQKEQQALGEEEQQIQFAIMQKREELLQPILTDLDSIIHVVATEGKYTMIFDKSINGAVLYAVETDDLTEAVRTRIKKD